MNGNRSGNVCGIILQQEVNGEKLCSFLTCIGRTIEADKQMYFANEEEVGECGHNTILYLPYLKDSESLILLQQLHLF